MDQWAGELVAATIVGLAGWAASVEYRLGTLLGMRDKISRIEEQTDILVEHLIHGQGHSRRPSSPPPHKAD